MKVDRLTQEHVAHLAPRLREHDLIDCAASDYDAHAALTQGITLGPAFALLDGDTQEPMGAFGFCPDLGSVWSLWAEGLTAEHRRFIMANTVTAVRTMVLLAGCPLHNYVWEGNRLTLAWLRASKCFEFAERPIPYKGHNYIRFNVKPLGDLPHV